MQVDEDKNAAVPSSRSKATRKLDAAPSKTSSWITDETDGCRCYDCNAVFTSRELIGEHIFCPKCGSYDVMVKSCGR